MASLNVLCFNPFNLKNKIVKIEHKKIFCDPSKILKNIQQPINICLKYSMAPQKPSGPPPPSYILNVRSLSLIFFNVGFLSQIWKIHKIGEKGMRPYLFLSTMSHSQTFVYLFAVLHLRLIPSKINFSACNFWTLT